MTVPSHDEEQPAPAASPSFDPSTWLKPAEPVAAPPKPPAEASPSASATPPAGAAAAQSSRRLLLIGGGAAGAVVLAGGAALLLRKPAAKPAAVASTASGAGGAGLQQVLTLANLDGLDPALASNGLAATARTQIATAARSALPADAAAGELRMELALARDAGGAVSLQTLTLTQPDGRGVKVTPAAQGFAAAPLTATTTAVVKVARGQMDANSFYSSAVSSGLIDAMIPQFFQAFVYDFDFQREIKPGDVFEAAYQQRNNARSEAVGTPELLYASMVTQQKSRALYRFTPPGQKTEWFDGSGRSIRRSLMRTPVEGARISSTFGMRNHPVLGFTRAHKGTDFATPVGTPVFASGAGKVTWVGPRGDFGNFITIQHTPMLVTAYAHLDKFADGLKIGADVSQGQQIGLTGNTGLTSGPHLHYEVRVNGEQVDSQTYQTEEGLALAGAILATFVKERDRIDAARAASV
ncbi:MAG TPA: M23 family metallopeptidase [Caulobacteraceae bacterium]